MRIREVASFSPALVSPLLHKIKSLETIRLELQLEIIAK